MSPALVLRSTTRLVQLNVIAQKGGQPASGLKKEDFIITDNGKSQAIAVFAENSSGPLPASTTPLPPNTFTNRLEQRAGTPASITVILLDDVNTRATQLRIVVRDASSGQMGSVTVPFRESKS